ncbi:MAG: DsbE family thiol:disulfide interchange protein [Paracoccaceae bacterium]
MSDETAPAKSGFRLWMLFPALGAAMVLAVFMLELQRGDAQILPSVLIDKPVPEFSLEPLRADQPVLDTAALSAPGIKLVNIWASWCGPCRVEHPQIEQLAAAGITVHGLNYKDAPENAEAFLAELGDPYTLIGTDKNGRAGIEFGVYGVPETFVVDGSGTIVFKHVGPVMDRDVPRLFEAIEKAQNR